MSVTGKTHLVTESSKTVVLGIKFNVGTRDTMDRQILTLFPKCFVTNGKD